MATLLFIHGFATGPAIWQARVKEFAKDFKVVSDIEQVEPGQDLFIIGWSMGGWKAFDLWQEHHQKIKGLVLVSAFAKYAQSDDYPFGTSPALLRKLEKKFQAGYRTGMHYFYDLIFKNKDLHSLIDRLPEPSQADLEHWFVKLRNEDFRPVLPKINVPVLIVQGEADPIVSPDSAKFLNSQIKNSELHLLPGVGHAPFLEAPAEFNSLLRGFLKNNAAK